MLESWLLIYERGVSVMNFLKMYFYIALCLLPISLAYAGWSEETRLTFSRTEFHPQVITRGDTIHVVSYNADYISYLRSTDGGATWDSLINLSEEEHIVVYPDISLGENGLLVSWQDRDHLDHVAYTTSVDGSNWTPPVHLNTQFLAHLHEPASTVKGDSIFISYFAYANDSTGEQPLRLLSSYDYGQNWNPEVTICYPHSTQQTFILKYCGSALLLVKAGFVDTLHSGYHVVGYRSEDAGRTWSDLIWISPEQLYSSQSPCVACNDETGQIAVGYTDYRFQEYAFFGDIFIAISDDEGLTWPREVRATQYPTATFPTIDYIGDTLMAAWSDRRFGSPNPREIFLNRSNDNGAAWLGEARLTDNLYLSTEPWLTFENSKIHVTWRQDEAYGYSDIYYKQFDPSITDISEVPETLPETFFLMAYPNPFNSTLEISITTFYPGVLSIYDILGRLVKAANYDEGKSSLIWDTSENNLSTGVYFLRLEGGDGVSYTKSVLYLK